MERYTTLAETISGKMARDLARLLDEPLFAVDSKQGSYGLPQQRERAYNRLCRLCVDAGVALPDLEPELIACYLPQNPSEKDVAVSKALADEIDNRTSGGSRQAFICQAVAAMLECFPNVNNVGNIDKKSLIALANKNLLELGEKPIRPEYPPIAVRQSPPPRPVTILIVDDEADKILETAIALAGWPDVEIKWLHHGRSASKLGWNPSQDDIDAAAASLAKAIIDSRPGIVLMDQGIDGKLEGHLVVRKVLESTLSILFVANTGGNEDKLMDAGCVAGARKGENMARAMQTAFGALS